MGDTSDGSSSAAQSAQPEAIKQDQKPGQGFFTRLFGGAGSANGQGGGQINGIHLERNGYALTPAGGLANLNRVRVEDVAVPRAEIVSAPVEIELATLVDTFRESGLTRLPVFDETLDTPLGFVHLKDLALRHGFACDDAALDLKAMLRPLLFAPPSMPIGVLLQKMQTSRVHMALVIDEYGGVDGLVTIEDLIEQVVGEIEDEHDIDEGEFWSEESPGTYLCQAKTPLEEFEAEIGINLLDRDDDDETETLGGLVFVLSGHVPVRGEVIEHESGVEFEVIEADPRRVKRLRVCMPFKKAG
ncbi:MAG: HlyC/CorC family transporter [Alphaproteobacteria bacterium]|nr:HlyC/CorC family transporter [Alphaproteobacteria bacterium]